MVTWVFFCSRSLQDDYLFLYRAVESLVCGGGVSNVGCHNPSTNSSTVMSSETDSRHSLTGQAQNGHLVASVSPRSSLVASEQSHTVVMVPPCGPPSSAASSPVPRTPTLPSPSSVSLERIMLAGNGSPV